MPLKANDKDDFFGHTAPVVHPYLHNAQCQTPVMANTGQQTSANANAGSATYQQWQMWRLDLALVSSTSLVPSTSLVRKREPEGLFMALRRCSCPFRHQSHMPARGFFWAMQLGYNRTILPPTSHM